ncbi:hypothetical protein [Novipirellula sp.]|uniref:hypothetical protein n=1 Tax=Novipirellula sp. TaxID=2795430 RepID=UPI003565E472
MIRLATLTMFIFTLGCTDSGVGVRSMDAQRMSAIVAHAQERATDSRHRELLARGNVFVDLDGLDIPCVGVTVPNDSHANRIHVSFTQDWFRSHSDDEIAEAMLEDLQRALTDPASDD